MKRRSALGLAVLGLAAAAGCGSSGTTATAPTSTSPATSPAPALTSAATPTPSSPQPSPSSPAAAASGAKTATCVNGWTAAAPGSAFYSQAQQAVTDTLKSSHQLKAVRYFAGPLVAGGIGAVYYVELVDPAVRMVVVSGGGPAAYAVASTGTHGWKAGDWTGFRGTEAPAAHPPLPGSWGGPAFDPVTGGAALLSPQLIGCLDGT